MQSIVFFFPGKETPGSVFNNKFGCFHWTTVTLCHNWELACYEKCHGCLVQEHLICVLIQSWLYSQAVSWLMGRFLSTYLSSREPVLLKRYLSSTVHKTTFQTFQIVVKVLSWENKRKRCFSLLLLSLLLSAAAVLVLLLLFFSVPLISRAFGEASDEPEVCSLFPRFFSSRLVC